VSVRQGAGLARIGLLIVVKSALERVQKKHRQST
jgi:hypothetical protein